MPLPSPVPPPVDEGWQLVSPEWWRIPFNAVSWAYTPTDPQYIAPAKNLKAAQSPRVAVAKPPHYHAALFHIRAASLDDQCDDDLAEWDDGRLNPDLVGLKGAVAALESYEIDVGFHWAEPLNEAKPPPDLTRAVDADHAALAKERWDELVLDLTGGLTIANTDRYNESDGDSLRGLHRSTSTHSSSIDLTDSERSVLSASMPATPRGPRSYANIVVKSASTSPSRSATSSGSRDSDRSPRRLNAAASSFVPSPAKAKDLVPPFLAPPAPVPFPTLNYPHPRTPTPPSPSPSPTFNMNTTFVFPSLDVPPLPAVNLARDAQGFYSEVESTTTPSSAHTGNGRTASGLLPAFLHRRPGRAPASKTRAMVDRLKSGAAAEKEPRPQLELAKPKPRLSVSEYGDDDGDSPPIEDDRDGDDGGWIGISVGESESAARAATANPKARRTRDLFLALTRRRSNSSPPKATLIEPPADDVIGITVELPSPTSASSDEASGDNENDGDNDGWIEGAALRGLADRTKPTLASLSLPERKATPVSVPETKLRAPPPPSRTPKKVKRIPGPVPALHVSPAPALYVRPPPPPPYYYAHPHPHAPVHAVPVGVPPAYAAAYHLQVHQMQMLQHQQMQQHMRRVSAPVVPIPVRTPRGSVSSTGSSGEWFPYGVPVSVPVPVAYPVGVPVFAPRGV